MFEFRKQDRYPPSTPKRMTRHVDGVKRVVIDNIQNQPLRSFTHVPDAISTKVEGWLQEAWFRLDPSLHADDLIQRMPYKAEHGVYDDRKVINRLVRRRELFRDEGKCLSWRKATHLKKWDKALIEEMQGNPSPEHPNSTRHLQDLTPDETRTFKEATYLTKTYLKRGKGRLLQGERRRQKDRSIVDRKARRAAGELKKRCDKAQTKQESDDSDDDWPGKETQQPKIQTLNSLMQQGHLGLVLRYRPLKRYITGTERHPQKIQGSVFRNIQE